MRNTSDHEYWAKPPNAHWSIASEGMANHTTYRKRLHSLKELYQSGDSGDEHGQAKGLIKTARADKHGPYEDICNHIGATIA